jgi:hypothetical protein
MTTPTYGDNDPFTTTPTDAPQHAATPIGDAAGSGSSAAESAKDTAKDALSSASDHGSQLADTAKEEAADVVAEAKDKATDLLSDVKAQADEQSKTQLKNLATKIGELADELDDLVRGSETSGTVTGAAQQLADKTRQLSSHLDSRQPLDLLEDVRGFARRRPVAFLGGAAVAGVLAGRLTRGAKASQGSDASSATGSAPTATAPATTPTASPSHASTGGLDSSGLGSSGLGSSGLGSDVVGSVDSVPPNQNTGGRQ